MIFTSNEEVTIAIGNTKTPSLDEMMPRFPHIVQDIFKELDNKSLTNCRNVSRVYRDFIDNEIFHSVRKIQGFVYMTEFQQQWNKVLNNIPTQVKKEIFGRFEQCFQYDWYKKKLQWSPLHIAAEQGQLEVCKFMIERTRYANPMRKDGITEIQMATFIGFQETCDLLRHHFTTTMTDLDHIAHRTPKNQLHTDTSHTIPEPFPHALLHAHRTCGSAIIRICVLQPII